MGDAKLRDLISVWVLVTVWPAAAFGVTTELPSTSGSIKIDGVMDDVAWRDAAQIILDVETSPGENIPARVQTTAYLVEDGENLYIGFKAYDPDQIGRASCRERV